jgi:AcrR family transcriptional regulator
MTSSSRDRGAATRERIVRATAALIAETGWSGFSTRDIARRAGVTQAVVTYHWRSKDELVREAALAAAQESLAPVAAALRDAPSARAALEQSLGVFTELRHEPALTALMFDTMLQGGRDELLRAALATLLRDFRAELAHKLEHDGVARPQALAAALTAALDGLFLHAVVDDRLDVLEAGEALLSLLDVEPQR